MVSDFLKSLIQFANILLKIFASMFMVVDILHIGGQAWQSDQVYTISLFVMVVGTLNHRSFSLLGQLKDLAAGTAVTLVCNITSSSPRGRNHFGVALVPAWATCRICWGGSCFGGMPAKVNGLKGA